MITSIRRPQRFYDAGKEGSEYRIVSPVQEDVPADHHYRLCLDPGSSAASVLMLSLTFRHNLRLRVSQVRTVSMAAMSGMGKKEGDISDSFASMSGQGHQPLPNRFRELKLSLVAGHEAGVQDGWNRLLRQLKKENDEVASRGSNVIPEVDFDNLENDLVRLGDEIRKRGAAVVKGVIPEAEARAYKTEIEEYVRKNPSTRGTHSHLQMLGRPLTSERLPGRQAPGSRVVLVITAT